MKVFVVKSLSWKKTESIVDINEKENGLSNMLLAYCRYFYSGSQQFTFMFLYKYFENDYSKKKCTMLRLLTLSIFIKMPLKLGIVQQY